MAEAVAFGIAANVLAFLEFGGKTALKFHKFYAAARDGPNLIPDLNSITKDLSQCLLILKDESLESPAADNASSLLQLAQECQNVAHQLQSQLNRLVPGKKGKIEATQRAWKAIWSEAHINQLQQRLEGFRAQLTVHMLVQLRHQSREAVVQQRQMFDAIDAKIEALHQQKALEVKLPPLSRLGRVALDDSARGAGTLLLDRFKLGAHVQGQSVDMENWELQLVQGILQPADDQSGLRIQKPQLSDDRLKLVHRRFLGRFKYSQMDDRQTRIDEAHEEAFRWIWKNNQSIDQQWSSFPDWLASSSSLYWVTGKAGSGKSTLMKYIFRPSVAIRPRQGTATFGGQRCSQHLRQWAKDGRLITAAFFFWTSGVELQTTLEGLMRTLLHQILSQAKDLIAITSPHVWEVLCLFDHGYLLGDSTDTEVQRMFSRLLENLPADIRLCCFVDGLDEFQGDPAVILELVQRMTSNPNIKMCVASRPWTAFEDAFHQSPGLMLEDLTQGDIKAYTTSKLMKERAFRQLHERQPTNTEALIDFIVGKASGVFLWVYLVVASLIVGMRDGDRLSDLQKRLEALPTELEDLFAHMVDNLKPEYLAHAATILELMRSQDDPPSILLLSFADEESHEGALKRVIEPLKEEEAAILHDSLRRRLKSRTMGLLEVSKPASMDSAIGESSSIATVLHGSVQYLHRTVKDYLNKEKVHMQFQKVLDPQFDVHLRMCIGQLSVLKVIPSGAVANRVDQSGYMRADEEFRTCIERFMQHASQVRGEYGPMIIQLMDNLDQSARAVTKRNLARFRSLPVDMVSIACRSGVTLYVAARAPSKTRKSPPLLSEAMSYNIDPLPFCASLLPSVPTIGCLLAKGYTIEDEWYSATTWKTFIVWDLLIFNLGLCKNKKQEAVFLRLAELAFYAGSRMPSKVSYKTYHVWPKLRDQVSDENLDAAYAKVTALYRSIPRSELPSRLRLSAAKLKTLFSKPN